MIYLKNGNIPLNFAFDDEIIQEANSTYQLTFKFPVNDSLFSELKEEVLLLADDLHGEQEFIIFEIVNNHGYCTVYANQVASLLNSYSVSEINVDRVSGYRVMSELAGSIIRDNDFSLFSDIDDKHTLNLKNTSAMNALAKDKHSIIGQWGGDLVRDKYDIRLLKNGGSENESLFMYKKNMKSYTQNKSIKELRTRIHFRRKKDNSTEESISVTVDSPLINKYQNIYEYDMEVNDQDVTDLRTLTEYGKKYFRETLCDVIEESIEIDVVGVNDIDVRIFDVVSIFHEKFGVDIRKKITKYRYSPMGKKLKSIGFGKVQQGLSSTISGIVNNEVTHQTRNIHADVDARVEKELKNADLAFDRKVEKFQQSINDIVELNKAKVEEKNEELRQQLQSKIEAEATKNQELIDEFKQSFDATKHDLINMISEGSPDVSALRNEFNSEISELRTEATRLTNEVREEANNLVNNIKVGSRNYILNSGTMTGNTWYSRGANWRLQNDEYLKLPIFSWVSGSYKETPIANVTVKTGETYTFSSWVKRDNPGRLYLYLYDTTFNNDARLDIRRDHTFENNAEWQFIKITFTATRDGLIKIRYAMVNSDNGGFSFTPFMLERGNIATDWRPAPEDVDYTRDISDLRTNIERTANGLREDVTRINQRFDNSGNLVELSRYKTEREATDRDITTKITEYRQTVDGQIAEVRGIASNFRQEIDNINLNVSSLNSDTVKYADIDISDNGIRFGSRAEIDGNTLGSIISLSPDGIRAVADKMIITANNENLVRLNCKSVRLNQRYVPASVIKFSDELKNGDEFLINMQYGGLSGAYPSISIGVVYDDNSKFYIVKEIPHANNGRNVTLKISGITKKVKEWWIDYHLNLNSDFPLWIINNCVVYKKKSAELIVDGSITTDKFNANEIVAGSTFTNMIKSIIGNFDYANIGNATIDNAKVTNMSLVELITKKIIAHEAFINKVKAIEIDASKITSGYFKGDIIRGGIISGTVIDGVTIQGNSKIKIGEHGFLKPAYTGLHICSPETANARYGVGVQILGNTGRNNTSPYGVYIYKDPDFYSSRTESTTSYILTVGGYIKADGICNLKLTNYNDGSTGIRLWSGKRPELIFTDVENDIMYSWGGTKYPLWRIIQYHYSSASDKRIKRNITDSTLDALDLVEKLKFKEFDFIHNDLFEGKHVNNGLIAQELQELDDSLVYENNDILTIDSFKMLNIALKAIQELSEKINRLEKKLYAS